MLVRIILFIVEVAGDVLAAAFLARFLLQWTRASFRNPIGQFLIAVTDWAVRPARKVVPGLFGLDLSSLLLAWLVQLGSLVLAYVLTTAGHPGAAMPVVPLLLVSLVEVARLTIHLAMLVVLVMALLSWINPHAPLAPFFNALARPLLAPIPRLIPPIGGIDLSPLFLLLALQVLLMVLDSLRGMAFGIAM
jgi:YggT family protein